jgi:hypothetical protein
LNLLEIICIRRRTNECHHWIHVEANVLRDGVLVSPDPGAGTMKEEESELLVSEK